MSDQVLKAHALRALHAPGTPLVLFNCWDAGSARAIAAAGARAVATASWAVAAANGYADGEHLPRDLAIANIGRIARAVALPVTADLERGYGETPADVADTVTQAIRAGAVGCNLEDGDTAGGLRPAAEQAPRLQAARRRPTGSTSRSSSTPAPTASCSPRRTRTTMPCSTPRWSAPACTPRTAPTACSYRASSMPR
jgi:2-methylisocitrate lyase-like PEP mutase family enzyme